MTVYAIAMNARTQSAKARRRNEKAVRSNNILRKMAGRNAGRMILLDLEHEFRALD